MTTRTGAREDRLSLDDFLALPEEEGYRLELSRGRIVREPAPGPRHGHLATRILGLVQRYGEGAGLCFVETGFMLAREPATVRAPDVAFVSNDRVPSEGLSDRFWELAPDLAVEVVSPSNTASEVQRKALDYLAAGTHIVWIVDPAAGTVTVYGSRTEIRILEGDDVLTGGDVLAGLGVPVSELLAGT